MITLHNLTNLEDIMLEGKRMHNALQCAPFVQPMLDAGTQIFTFINDGVSFANISVDQGVVTNIVGPHNAPVSEEELALITKMIAPIAIVRDGHTHGGERMVGTARSEEELIGQITNRHTH